MVPGVTAPAPTQLGGTDPGTWRRAGKPPQMNEQNSHGTQDAAWCAPAPRTGGFRVSQARQLPREGLELLWRRHRHLSLAREKPLALLHQHRCLESRKNQKTTLLDLIPLPEPGGGSRESGLSSPSPPGQQGCFPHPNPPPLGQGGRVRGVPRAGSPSPWARPGVGRRFPGHKIKSNHSKEGTWDY